MTAEGPVSIHTLFAGQWRNGMVPHIVFDPAADGYWPGPAQWECARYSEDAPEHTATSGICDPPVHAIAVDRILTVAAAESAIGLAILVVLFRNLQTINVDDLDNLKG